MRLLSFLFFFIVSFSISSFATEKANENFHQLIVGGEDADKNEFPFQASIQSEREGHYCGGSLISQNWVLTAAHCLYGDQKDQLKVVMGLHNQDDLAGTEVFLVEDVIIHPKYNNHDLEYDIALIKLNGNSSLPPVHLNENELHISPVSKLTAWVSGWGMKHQNDMQIPKILQKVELPLITQEECNKPDSYDGAVKDHMICAGLKQGGKDSCQCDSGGPLFLRSPKNEFKLIGIVSYGEGCARPEKYGVYTKVNFFYEWVQQQISE